LATLMETGKSEFLALIALSLILVLLSGNFTFYAVKASPLPPSWMDPQMIISIQSPLPGQERKSSYGVPILLDFTAHVVGNLP
jgi:hypothetical protein